MGSVQETTQPKVTEVSSPEEGSNATTTQPQGPLVLPPVGGIGGKIEALPAATINNSTQAAERLTVLKVRANHLFEIYENFSDVLIYALCCVLLGPCGLLCAPCVSERSTVESNVRAAILAVFAQVHLIRARYGNDETWKTAEESVKINKNIFNGFIDRTALQGSL